jgi:hypothetical protein
MNCPNKNGLGPGAVGDAIEPICPMGTNQAIPTGRWCTETEVKRTLPAWMLRPMKALYSRLWEGSEDFEPVFSVSWFYWFRFCLFVFLFGFPVSFSE